ncbi:long-chain fatty-acid-CoA ligase [Exophiala viscosa]|uniref:long-chain fatty-acid-CoA ligase n=1 Tax=Exophiala viscosa TaxID=2486360 RepID=UPI002194E6AD|nr:long-chain fatty-acid-CoA ligase [Exophiala viscosa]
MALASTEPTLSQSRPPSIVHGSTETPLLDLTLGELLDLQCRRYASRECLIVPWTGARWTYGHLRKESNRIAKALLRRGIRSGDRIAIMAGNCEQYVSVFFAAMRIGCILVIFNNTYTSPEAQYALRFTECRLLFTTPRIGHCDNRPLLDELRKTPGTVEEIIILRGHAGQYTSYASLAEHGACEPDEVLAECANTFGTYDVCNLQFTSGTTGHPKAAMLTHHSLVNNSRFIGDRLGFTEDDVLCCPPPLFHCFGLVLGLLAVISHGGKVIYPAETFNAAACMRAIHEEQCTALHGVPAMFDSVFSLPRPDDFDCHRLRTGIIAGAPVPQYLMKLLFSDLGMTEFTSSYGLTEASPTCFNAMYSDPIDLKLSTVGQVMPHAHAKIVDRDGKIVPIGERGELCIAGYQLQRGYWKNPDKTSEVMIRDETGVLWLHTGDEAVFHEDKTCTITGRFKDIIIRGGENIYPLEVEERLTQHEAIERAIVVGAKHRRLGEVVVAFLQGVSRTSRGTVATLSDDEVREWVKMRLGRHKAPAHVFWFGRGGIPEYSAVPLTGSGKVRKYELARVAEQILEGAKPKL